MLNDRIFHSDSTGKTCVGGSCMMRKFTTDEEAKEAMLCELDGFLLKPEDRALFGLPKK